MKIVALIPLRGGSKGIPDKNIRPIAGRPLCHWVIEAAAGCSRIDRIYVATDSPAIAKVVRDLGHPKVEVVSRSPESATDGAPTESVMLEFSEQREFEHLVLIQATSPLLRGIDLDQGISRYLEAGADSLLSTVPQRRFIWEGAADGFATPRNYRPAQRPRRQDFPPYFVENGAFYICTREGLLRERCRLFGRTVVHEMAESSYWEIDEPDDWAVVERFLEQRQTKAGAADLRAKAARIRLFLTDVDGVLTDSGMYYSEHGDELKKFNTRDGMGIQLLREAGIQTGILTSEQTELVGRRAEKLRIDIVVQGARDKAASLANLLKGLNLRPDEIAYIGDDLMDREVLAQVGLSACPTDAHPNVKESCNYICRKRGGEGCVREFAELILNNRESRAG